MSKSKSQWYNQGKKEGYVEARESFRRIILAEFQPTIKILHGSKHVVFRPINAINLKRNFSILNEILGEKTIKKLFEDETQ